MKMSGQHQASAALDQDRTPPGTHGTKGGVGRTAGVDTLGGTNLLVLQVTEPRFLDRLSHSLATIPTELSWLRESYY
jgi:hypothetical protein